MKNILIIGAGFSTRVLVEYLAKESEKRGWKIVLADMNIEACKTALNNHPNGTPVQLNVDDEKHLDELVKNADIVVSMLPARFHPIVAKKCLEHSKNMATASYVSKEMAAMDEEVEQKGLIFLNEIGLDPGIDHISAMRIINRLKSQNAEITSFKSYTGGLIAPQYDNNPWNYKFTWNPRNVVLAGQGVAKFVRNGQYKYIPYHRLFKRTDKFYIDGYGEFEGYPNRDSLAYRSIYGLDNIPTMIRGTLRRNGFAESWDIFVQLGMTDDTYIIEDSENLTYRDFINSFLPYHETKSVEEKLCDYLNLKPDDENFYKIKWLGLFENKKIGLKKATPAQILQKILVEKWSLDKGDRDMIVMQHIFEYKLNGKNRRLYSTLVVEGKDSYHTAMAITVGTPLAIGVKSILTGKIKAKGVQIPVIREIYEPVMQELEDLGIRFVEKEEEI